MWEGHGNPPGAQNGHKKIKKQNVEKIPKSEFAYLPGGGLPIFPRRALPVPLLGQVLVEDLQYTAGTLKLRSSVHVEAFPTDQVEETRWIASLNSAEFPVGAIIANANISLQKENEKSSSTQAHRF